MARIRTIKPEFPQSESMGRVSRDARLLFVLLWTLADDSGRLRGHSRMLASLLFPYDDDSPKLIDGWLSELVNEKCINLYTTSDGSHYVAVLNWERHQKIDKPSESKLPAPCSDDSRMFANPLESSRSVDPSRASLILDPGPGPGPGTGGCKGGGNSDNWEIPKRLDTPEVRKLLDDFEAMRKRKKKPIDSKRDASLVFKHFDDSAHLVFALETCIANKYQGLKADYRPTAGNGSPAISKGQREYEAIFGKEKK